MSQLTLEGLEVASTRHPFAWVGSKRRFVRDIMKHFPYAGADEMVSPFIGGGAVEVACAAAGKRVHAYDGNPDLARLWGLFLDRPHVVADRIAQLRGCTIETMKEQVVMDGKEPDERALALFFRVQCCLYATPSSTMLRQANPNKAYKAGKTDVWRDYLVPYREREARSFRSPNLTVDHLDCFESLAWHATLFAYCDPPYWEESGKAYASIYAGVSKGFDHDRLALQLKTRPGGWVLSINDCEWARDTFASYRMVPLQVRWMLGARRNQKRERRGELLIVSEGW